MSTHDQQTTIPVTRRQFLAATAAVVTVVSLPVLTARADDAKKADAKEKKPVDCGELTKFDKDGVTDTHAKKPDNFFLIRADGKLYACTSLCTHKNYPLTVKDDELYCEKHKSEFSLQGTVTHGPAKRSLPRYGIKTDDKGVVFVDTAKEYAEKDWDDEKSFVKVEKK